MEGVNYRLVQSVEGVGDWSNQWKALETCLISGRRYRLVQSIEGVGDWSNQWKAFETCPASGYCWRLVQLVEGVNYGLVQSIEDIEIGQLDKSRG